MKYANTKASKEFELIANDLSKLPFHFTYDVNKGAGEVPVYSTFTYSAKCSELIDASGVVSFSRAKEAAYAAAKDAKIGTEYLDIASCDVTLEWESRYYWSSNDSKLLVNAPQNVQTVNVYSGAYSYRARLDGSSGSRALVFDQPFNYDITAVSMTFAEVPWIWESSVSFFSADYNSGFIDGYDGAVSDLKIEYSNAASEQYYKGYDRGLEVGFNSGYEEGKVWGAQIAESGDFRELLTSVVDAPIKALSGLFNFEILGQNMLEFVGAILSLCVILFVLKKVLK